MTSVAPARFRVVLTEDPATKELVERQEFWPETQWTPTSALGVFFKGDQTALSADGTVTFLDCHVLPGTSTVYPFGDWTSEHVGSVGRTLTVDAHGPSGTQVLSVVLEEVDGRLHFAVPAGTVRVCS